MRDFGYYAGEWNLFIYGDKNHEEHIQLFGDFLHEMDGQDVEASKDKIINRLDADHPMYHLITKNMPCVLKNGEWHKRLSIHPVSGLIRLFQNTSYRSDKDAYLLGQEVLQCQENEDWIPWRFYNANVEGKEEYCLYADHKVYDVAIDLLFEKEQLLIVNAPATLTYPINPPASLAVTSAVDTQFTIVAFISPRIISPPINPPPL